MHPSHARMLRTHHTRPPSNPARNARTYRALHVITQNAHIHMYAREKVISTKKFLPIRSFLHSIYP